MGPTMNLISGTHHLCERREYTFMVLREYTIISLVNVIRVQIFCLIFPTPSHTPPINICHMYTYLSKIIFNLSLFQFPNINQKLKNPNPPAATITIPPPLPSPTTFVGATKRRSGIVNCQPASQPPPPVVNYQK